MPAVFSLFVRKSTGGFETPDMLILSEPPPCGNSLRGSIPYLYSSVDTPNPYLIKGKLGSGTDRLGGVSSPPCGLVAYHISNLAGLTINSRKRDGSDTSTIRVENHEVIPARIRKVPAKPLDMAFESRRRPKEVTGIIRVRPPRDD